MNHVKDVLVIYSNPETMFWYNTGFLVQYVELQFEISWIPFQLAAMNWLRIWILNRDACLSSLEHLNTRQMLTAWLLRRRRVRIKKLRSQEWKLSVATNIRELVEKINDTSSCIENGGGIVFLCSTWMISCIEEERDAASVPGETQGEYPLRISGKGLIGIFTNIPEV